VVGEVHFRRWRLQEAGDGVLAQALVVVLERVVLLATTAALWTLSGWLSRRKRAFAEADTQQVCKSRREVMEKE